jgi:hypothetical protein
MKRLTRQATKPDELPNVHEAVAGTLAAGNVYVGLASGNQIVSGLDDNQKAVLQTPGSPGLELRTRSSIGSPVSAPGTYLNTADVDKLSNRVHPTMRKYGLGDTLRKVGTTAGLVLLGSAVFALTTAVASVVFLVLSEQQPSTTEIADKAQTVLSWVSEPVERLPRHVNGEAREAAREMLVERIDAAGRCFQQLQGHETEPATIPSISCSSTRVPWWRASLTGSLAVGVIAIITAALGMVALTGRYGFQRSPSG